jgi:hypothetical protein
MVFLHFKTIYCILGRYNNCSRKKCRFLEAPVQGLQIVALWLSRLLSVLSREPLGKLVHIHCNVLPVINVKFVNTHKARRLHA